MRSYPVCVIHPVAGRCLIFNQREIKCREVERESPELYLKWMKVLWTLPGCRSRTGASRLSGWQPVGNWVASGANFPASLIPVGFSEQKNRDPQFAPKNGQKPKPSGWPAYTSSAHRKGETIPRGWVVFSAAPAGAGVLILSPAPAGLFLGK
jgi:hypothetical protein